MPDDKIFPVVDRPAPVLDRIRGEESEGESVEKEMGKRVGKFFKNEDEQVEAAELADSVSEFRAGLAEELNVDEKVVSDGVIDSFAELLRMDVIPMAEEKEGSSEEEPNFSAE